MKNYSKQREAILQVLRHSKAHPTAAQVYSMVKETIPNISLGTVYRNLADLSQSGAIITVNVGDGYEHYDGDISPHLHLHCRKCGSIEDAVICDDSVLSAARLKGFRPDSSVYVVYGQCKDCIDNN